MTNSLFSSKHALLLLPALLLTLASCSGSDDGEDGQPDCFNGDSPSLPNIPDSVIRLGRITLAQETTFDASGTRADDTWLTADFADYTEVVVFPRQPTMVATPGCYGLTGTGTTVCREGYTEPCTRTFLPVDSVAIEGLAGGPTELSSNSEGKFSLGGLQTPLFVDSAAKAKVTATTDGKFPSFDLSVPVPDLLEITGPTPSAATPLGAQDLDLEWEPGNGDYIVISISATGINDKIQCIVKDDGCHSIQVGDLEFFDITDGVEFKVTMIRERSVVQSLDDQTAVELKADSKVEMILQK